MKSFITLLGIIVLLTCVRSAYSTEISDYINEQNCDQILNKKFYKVCYDYKAKGAKYVAYALDGEKVTFGNIKKRPRFYPDREIRAKYRTTSSDYTKNEFHADRSHLAPDASFDWSQKSLKSVYSMANVIPQYNKINRMTWVKAERYERMAARKLDVVTVINGVEYGDYSKGLKKSGIAYPEAFWKMLFDGQGFKKCFYYENDSHAYQKNDQLRDHEINCDLLAK